MVWRFFSIDIAMMIFNKKELCLTQSIRAQSEIREILSSNGIVYDLTTIDRAPLGGGNGTVREGYKAILLYKFKVKKSEYDKAKNLIARVKMTD